MEITTRSKIALFPYCLLFMSAFLLTYNGAFAMGQDQNFQRLKLGAILNCNSRVGREEKVAMKIAVEDLQPLISHLRPGLHVKDSQGDPLRAASSAKTLIKKHNVKAIIGLGTEELAYIAELGNRSKIPMLSLEKEAPPWSSWQWPFLLNAARSQHEQMKAVAAIVQSFQWRKVTVIYENTNADGQGLIPYLVTSLQEADSQVNEFLTLSFSVSHSMVSEKLKGLKNGQCRVFIVHTSIHLAAQIFLEAKKLGMMEKEFVWITTVSTTNLMDTLNVSVIEAMQGILGVKSYISKEGKDFLDFSSKFKAVFHSMYPDEQYLEPGISALQAYSAVWSVALALRVQKVKPLEDEKDHVDPTDSVLGQWLLGRILQSDFKDLVGTFRFTEGRLDPAYYFQIINVVGKSYRELGFWSVGLGFSESLGKNSSSYSKSMMALGQVFWPGGPWSIPRGWALPVSNETLVFAVPTGGAFKEFVNVTFETPGGEPKFSGFSIEVFKQVVQSLPYHLPYKLIPCSGTYDSLVKKIKLKEIDAIVGDTAIVAERYEYAEFSQPYSEVGLQMLLYDKPKKYNGPWLFIRPFSTLLWISTVAINIYNGFVVWLIERRHNQNLRGTWWKQIGTMLSISFSTLFSHQREIFRSNLSWMVVISWLFVALVLTQSFTASLTALLTSERIDTTVVDIESLKRNGDKIGCNGNSFVAKHLEVVHGISPNNIKKMYAEDDYPKAFMTGQIKAAFLQVPQVNFFLAKHCGGFRAGQTLHVAGFAFVFPRGSPYLPDISAAIVNVSQCGKLKELENSLLEYYNSCNTTRSHKDDHMRLEPSSFLGLFVISGGTSSFALVIFIVSQIRQIWYCRFNRRHHQQDPHVDGILVLFPEIALDQGHRR